MGTKNKIFATSLLAIPLVLILIDSGNYSRRYKQYETAGRLGSAYIYTDSFPVNMSVRKEGVRMLHHDASTEYRRVHSAEPVVELRKKIRGEKSGRAFNHDHVKVEEMVGDNYATKCRVVGEDFEGWVDYGKLMFDLHGEDSELKRMFGCVDSSKNYFDHFLSKFNSKRPIREGNERKRVLDMLNYINQNADSLNQNDIRYLVSIAMGKEPDPYFFSNPRAQYAINEFLLRHVDARLLRSYANGMRSDLIDFQHLGRASLMKALGLR